MKSYAYHAIDYAGEPTRGTIACATPEEASRSLGARGLYIVTIRERSGLFPGFRQAWLSYRVKKRDIVAFAENFSVMLDAGIPILTCLDDMAGSETNAALVPVLGELRQSLERGSSLSQALAAHGGLFPELLLTLVAVGEETGALVQSLKDAAEHLQRMETLKSGVKKALIYPAFAFSATLGALVFWLVFVIPSLSSTLKTLGGELPWLTRTLIEASRLCQAHWKLYLFCLGLAPFPLVLLGRHPRFRYFWDRTLIKTPVVEVIAYNKLLVTFCEQFRILTAAGIGIGRLFDLVIPSLGNAYFAAHLGEIKESILTGARISDSFERHDILPALALSKIRMGENTGTLDKQFAFLAIYYSRKLDDAIGNLGKIIEPLVMVVIGGLFAVIIMGLLLPIYDLVSKVGKG
jgi:type II secretory pathway component PulF